MEENVLAAQLYTARGLIRTADDLADVLKKVAAIGYRGVEMYGGLPVGPEDIATTVDRAGLKIVSAHVGWGDFREDIDKVIATHKLWNCTNPCIPGLCAEYEGLDGLERFCRQLPPVIERLAAEGMTLSYHNHSHELVRYGEKTWLEMLRESPQAAGLCFELDTYWIQAGGACPAEWIGKCSGRVPLVHFKDMAVTYDRQQRFAAVGCGNLNWPAILQAARQAGVRWYIVEQDDCYGTDPLESLAVSYRNLTPMGLK